MSVHILDKRLAFLKNIQTWTFALITLATLAYLGYTVLNTFAISRAEKHRLDALDSIEKKLEIEKNDLTETFEQTKRNLSRLEQITDIVDDKSKIARSITALEARTDSLASTTSSLNQKLDSLNTIIGSSPDKALALPLLKKDVDELKAESQRQTDELRGEMTRMYDMNKWLIGLILAALVGTIINNVIQGKKAEKLV